MKSVKKKGKTKGKKEALESPGTRLGDTIKGLMGEVENTGASLVSEVRQLFDDLTQKVNDVASSAAETTVAMAEKVTVKDPADLIRGMLEEIREASEVSIEAIGNRLEELRHHALNSTEEPAEKKTDKKRASKKKVGKKKVAKTAAPKKKKAKKKVAKKAVAEKAKAKDSLQN